jgi:hypothetical protein
MHDYRESQLPLMLVDVSEGEDAADVRLLHDTAAPPVRVANGSAIGDTPFEIVEIERRFIHSKQGKGKPVNVSRIIVRDRRSGDKHLVVKGIPAKSSQVHAVMSLGDRTRYDVRRGDEFEFVVSGSETEQYRVIDVRPTQIVVENKESGDAVTIERFGAMVGR